MKRGLSQNGVFIQALLAGQRQWIIGDTYTFTSATGEADYFSDMDLPINAGDGIAYKFSSLRIEGMKMKVAVGVSVDEQDVTIWAAPTDTLFGEPFLTAIGAGLMDGGTISRFRCVWNPITGNPSIDATAFVPAARWQMFLGYMSTVEKLGKASCHFKVKSPLIKLNMNMPRNFYQPSCLWTLFDDSLTTGQSGSGCTLLASNYAVSGTVGATGINFVTVPVNGGIATPTGADGNPNYQNGRLLFTSGVNDGFLAAIGSNDANNLVLAFPLPELPSPGDTFTYYPGCSKSFATCGTKFGNTPNFRGFDKVPSVYISI